MKTENSIDKQLREVFWEVFGLDEITDETSMMNVPHWDSLRHIELIMTLERVTGKTFSPMEAMEMSGVREILKALEKA